jgi:uncharacterized membrane protein YbhN (UPF0104 family)
MPTANKTKVNSTFLLTSPVVSFPAVISFGLRDQSTGRSVCHLLLLNSKDGTLLTEKE